MPSFLTPLASGKKKVLLNYEPPLTDSSGIALARSDIADTSKNTVVRVRTTSGTVYHIPATPVPFLEASSTFHRAIEVLHLSGRSIEKPIGIPREESECFNSSPDSLLSECA